MSYLCGFTRRLEGLREGARPLNATVPSRLGGSFRGVELRTDRFPGRRLRPRRPGSALNAGQPAWWLVCGDETYVQVADHKQPKGTHQAGTVDHMRTCSVQVCQVCVLESPSDTCANHTPRWVAITVWSVVRSSFLVDLSAVRQQPSHRRFAEPASTPSPGRHSHRTRTRPGHGRHQPRHQFRAGDFITPQWRYCPHRPRPTTVVVEEFDQGLIERFAQVFRAGNRGGRDPTLDKRGSERLLTRPMLNVLKQIRRPHQVFTEQEH